MAFTYSLEHYDSASGRTVLERQYKTVLIEIHRARRLRIPCEHRVFKVRNMEMGIRSFEMFAQDFIGEQVRIARTEGAKYEGAITIATHLMEVRKAKKDAYGKVDITPEELESFTRCCEKGTFICELANQAGFSVSLQVMTNNKSNIVMACLTLCRPEDEYVMDV